jgi:hypothetical protein
MLKPLSGMDWPKALNVPKKKSFDQRGERERERERKKKKHLFISDHTV